MFKGSTDSVLLAMFGNPQQDSHVKKWKWNNYMKLFNNKMFDEYKQ